MCLSVVRNNWQLWSDYMILTSLNFWCSMESGVLVKQHYPELSLVTLDDLFKIE